LKSFRDSKKDEKEKITEEELAELYAEVKAYDLDAI
jgi:hypothetical protein